MPNNLQASVARLSATLICSFLAAFAVSAQSELTTEADQLFERRGYFEAAREYVAVYAKVKSDIELKGYCAFQAGESYRLYNESASAFEWYNKAIGLKYGKQNTKLFLLCGDVLRDQENFDEAVNMYERFRNEGGDANVASTRIEKTNKAADMLEEPESRYEVELMLTLNSPAYDFCPAFTGDEQDVLVFASSRDFAKGSEEDPITGQEFMDLFRSELDNKGRWSEPEPMGNTICTEDNEGGACLDSEGRLMYFTRCVNTGNSNLACDIYFAKKRGGDFGASAALGVIDRMEDDSTQVGHPALSPDDEILIFASDLAGGYGGKDLWFVVAKDGSFEGATPQNLGANINTSGDDMFPYMRDNGDLYWSTNGREGLGGLDIWKAEAREGEMAFGKPQALPAPLNSVSDDFAISFKRGQEAGMFTSSRAGGKGSDDLYAFELPELEFCYAAYVYDENEVNLEGVTVSLEMSTGETIVKVTDADGFVDFCEGEIGEDVTFKVMVSLDGFLGQWSNQTTVNRESPEWGEEFFLEEIVTNKEYSFPEVLYPLASAELLVDDMVNSKDSLEFLVELLNNEESLVIELRSHTDSRGGASANMTLSQKRAETCVQYLIENGIAADRLVPRGMGESELLVSDADIARLPEDARESAHQRNRRTRFTILRFDYKADE
ncbi:MAG: OmpA family protein [Bacteroidota bacterium]|nr:OmpA family protein [Bacteroidota bacterium]